ncbi:hypothetical protein M9Y10_041721 [Tritrichomonas musculus]|uniref:non-specific serine/threonine protein kinase n=1 Tax=Tritrichomonas musculus TaxID=1915356 RepID=A0ABR2K5R1_9EUKA
MLQGGQIGGFAIVEKLSHGSFGQVFIVHSINNKELYAAKVEPVYTHQNKLNFEAKVLKSLQKSEYFPRYKTFGQNAHFSYLILELLGPSLTTVLKRLQTSKFSLSTGLRVAQHSLNAIEFFHSRGIIHRDIKPSNILVHINSSKYPISLIDFNLARYYIDNDTKNHLPERKNPGFRGTVTYASIHAHLNQELSRRDDLISWFYVITDLLIGDLPWRSLNNKDEIMIMKQNVSFSALLNPIVPEMTEIWQLIKKLKYDEEPDYQRIRILLQEAMLASNIEENSPYDWDELLSKKKEKENLDILDISESIIQSKNRCCQIL